MFEFQRIGDLPHQLRIAAQHRNVRALAALVVSLILKVRRGRAAGGPTRVKLNHHLQDHHSPAKGSLTRAQWQSSAAAARSGAAIGCGWRTWPVDSHCCPRERSPPRALGRPPAAGGAAVPELPSRSPRAATRRARGRPHAQRPANGPASRWTAASATGHPGARLRVSGDEPSGHRGVLGASPWPAHGCKTAGVCVRQEYAGPIAHRHASNAPVSWGSFALSLLLPHDRT